MENSCYKLFNLNFDNFSELINKYEPDIDQEHLFIIYNLIQNNRYALDDSLSLIHISEPTRPY